MVRIGIIGLRGMGKIRLKNFADMENVEVIKICTCNPQLLQENISQFNIASTTTDWTELVTDPDLDGICVCTPNNLHFEMAKAVLENNKHVLVEYPLVTVMEEVQTLVNLAQSSGKVLHLGLTMRYEPQHLKAKELLPSLGEPVEAQGFWSLPYIWKWADDPEVMGSYLALANFHFVDQLLDLYGQPDWVNAKLWKEEIDGKITKIFGSMFFGYPNQFSGYVTYGMGLPTQKSFPKFRLIHADGMVEFKDERLFLTQDGPESTEIHYEGDINDSYQRDSEAFIREIKGQPMAINLKGAVLSTKLCILAQKSADEGCRTIEI